MNIYKSIGLACLLTYSVHTGPVQAATALPQHPFADMKGSFAEGAVASLYQQGLVNGVTSETFRPHQPMNRNHFTLLLAQVIGLQPVFPAEPSFLDVPVDAPEFGYVEAVHQLGWMKGMAPQQFGAGMPITRQDVAVILFQVFGKTDKPHQIGTLPYKDHGQIKPYALEAVQYVTMKGLMAGFDGSFHPNKPITRAEAAVLCEKVLEQINERIATLDWIAPDKIVLKPGESKQIELPQSNGSIPFLYSFGFDQTEIGSITADGLFTAKQPGTAVISLNIGTKTYQIKVEVQEGGQPQ